MSETMVIPLKCPSCGGKLEISSDMDQFACGYCGSSLEILRRGGTVSLKRLTDAITKVQVGTDKTAAELALQRLIKELEPLKVERDDYETKWRTSVNYLERTVIKLFSARKEKMGNLAVVLFLVVGPVVTLFMGFTITSSFKENTFSDSVNIFFVCACIAFALVCGLYFLIDRYSRKDTELQQNTVKNDVAESRRKMDIGMNSYNTRIDELEKRIAEKKLIADA
jgi:predicted RNA-binding Zn-ribbon protein involved in translation (DUF1610 family)